MASRGLSAAISGEWAGTGCSRGDCARRCRESLKAWRLSTETLHVRSTPSPSGLASRLPRSICQRTVLVDIPKALAACCVVTHPDYEVTSEEISRRSSRRLRGAAWPVAAPPRALRPRCRGPRWGARVPVVGWARSEAGASWPPREEAARPGRRATGSSRRPCPRSSRLRSRRPRASPGRHRGRAAVSSRRPLACSTGPLPPRSQHTLPTPPAHLAAPRRAQKAVMLLRVG